jgi:hypothetical protein
MTLWGIRLLNLIYGSSGTNLGWVELPRTAFSAAEPDKLVRATYRNVPVLAFNASPHHPMVFA